LLISDEECVWGRKRRKERRQVCAEVWMSVKKRRARRQEEEKKTKKKIRVKDIFSFLEQNTDTKGRERERETDR